MKPILIVRHVAHEGPGYLADFLHERAVRFKVLAIDTGENIPSSPDEYSALVFMGGPMSVNDDLPWIPSAVSLIRRALEQDMPLLGHCLGGQLIARALGAAVYPNPVHEYGWLPVEVSGNEVARQWFPGLQKEFMAFHWHGETFDLPDGATHVLASADCHNQAFVYGNTLAMQCHIEMTPELVQDWVARADEQELAAADQTKEKILQDLDKHTIELQQCAAKVYSQWLERVRTREQAKTQGQT